MNVNHENFVLPIITNLLNIKYIASHLVTSMQGALHVHVVDIIKNKYFNM